MATTAAARRPSPAHKAKPIPQEDFQREHSYMLAVHEVLKQA